MAASSNSTTTVSFARWCAKAWQRLLYPVKPYWTASIYGFGKWIRRYGYYPPFLPLCIYTDHGPGENPEMPSAHELASSAPVQFYHSARKVERWRGMSAKSCYVLYSPFVFARKELGVCRDPSADGTVYFVAHSTPSIEEKKSIRKYHEEIASLPARYLPVTICLHIHDLRKGLGDEYAALGYRVVTAGDSLEAEFTERFYRILANHRYAISNVFGSYGLYAAEMGLPFGLFGAEPDYENKRDPNVENGAYRSYLHTPYYQKALELFGGLPEDEVTPAQHEFAAYYLGLTEGISRFHMARVLYGSLFSWLGERVLGLFCTKIRKQAKNQ